MILSLYARGITIRDIKAHLAEVYGVEVSHETVAKVTEVVVEEVRAWQSRRSMRCIRSCSSRYPDRPRREQHSRQDLTEDDSSQPRGPLCLASARSIPIRLGVLDALRKRYPLAVITDAQSAYAGAELHRVGLLSYSIRPLTSATTATASRTGRLFQLALDEMSGQRYACDVGNDMHRDIFRPQEAGIRTVMVDSDQGKKALPRLRT